MGSQVWAGGADLVEVDGTHSSFLVDLPFDTSWASLHGKPDLPVLPDVTQQVMLLANDPNASLTELAALLSRDAATAAHVLRLANSPLYRGREPIVSLHQAAARLGAKRLRDIAVVVASESRVFRARGFEAEARHAFTHGFLTGLWAQEIARRQRGPVEEAFLCGLLHDVGIPLLLQAACDALPDAIARRADVLTVVDDAHAAAGADLCRRWGLPERIANVLEHHHQLESTGNDHQSDLVGMCPHPPLESFASVTHPKAGLSLRLKDIVLLADDLADFCENDVDDAALVARVLAHPAAAHLNLYDEDVVELVARKAALLATCGALGAVPERKSC